MGIMKMFVFASVYIFLMDLNIVWAAIKTEPSNGASCLFIVVTVLGGIIAFMGIILAFRGVTSPADISFKIPNIGTFKLSKIGQGIVLVVIGAIILIFALYLSPTTITKTVTETITTEDADGTRSIHREMAR